MDIINPRLLQAAQDELAQIDPEQMKMNEDHDEGAADHNKATAALGQLDEAAAFCELEKRLDATLALPRNNTAGPSQSGSEGLSTPREDLSTPREDHHTSPIAASSGAGAIDLLTATGSDGDDLRSSSWACNKCTFLNSSTSVCEVCSTRRESTRSKSSRKDREEHSLGGRNNGGSSRQHIDPVDLEVGSRVMILCTKGNRWRATIRGACEKKGEAGFMIHYDGLKRNSEDWVSASSVVDIIRKEDELTKEEQAALQQKKAASPAKKRTKHDMPRKLKKRKKRSSCGQCEACLRENCGQCKHCLDMPKFGGNYTIKQKCLERTCQNIHMVKEECQKSPKRQKTSPTVERILNKNKGTNNGRKTAADRLSPCMKNEIKPLFKSGERVYAAWSDSLYYPGKVKSVKEVVKGSEYGPIRYYSIEYDDGDELDFVIDQCVFREEDYLLSARRQEWIGVKNVVDKKSNDVWAMVVGWYVATIDGRECSFSLLSEALRAYDASVIRRSGAKTKPSDLNLPEEFERTRVVKKEPTTGTEKEDLSATEPTTSNVNSSATSINVGDSVYGFWTNDTSCLEGGEWSEGTVETRKEGGVFRVIFRYCCGADPGRDLPGVLLVPKNDFDLFKQQMHSLREGDRVCAPRWRNETNTGEPQWHPGVIRSCEGSASRRVYCVRFDDDNEEAPGIKASLVFPERRRAPKYEVGAGLGVNDERKPSANQSKPSNKAFYPPDNSSNLQHADGEAAEDNLAKETMFVAVQEIGPPQTANTTRAYVGCEISQLKAALKKSEAALKVAEEDLGIANDTLTQEHLFTNSWQNKFERLASLVEGSGAVDGAIVSKIRNESISGGGL